MDPLRGIVHHALASLRITPKWYAWLLPHNIPLASLETLASQGELPTLPGLANAFLFCAYFGVVRIILQNYLFRVERRVLLPVFNFVLYLFSVQI